MLAFNISHPRDSRQQKATLVDLGLGCLARGEWTMVAAITRIIRARRWCHV
jgi:hypothetical protein